MFNKNLSPEDKINLIGLDSLDDIDKDAIIDMFENSWSGKTLYGKPSTNTLSSSAAIIYSSASTAAIFTQNLMILKQILQLKENQYKQNQEIIDLLKQLVMQN
ncbi:hypothetical protein [Candidatus Stoquefichus massiliensis]|uniref:hypothetical protein n=1 Tax=Candidatus Stoquefichus massiliensis TaxID=1470350 RepID=UPI000481D34D|nr:hypothetical protein [Candidatus Stoquefichus massiliensis]